MPSPTERILSALTDRNCDPKLGNKGWTAKCPAHEDRHPSLSVSEGDDGRALVRCHAGCSVDAICDAVGLPSPPMNSESTELRATGTDNRLALTSAAEGPQLATRGTESESGTPDQETNKPLENQGFDSNCQPIVLAGESAPSRTRTLNPLIKSQHATPEIPVENARSLNRAAPGAAVGKGNGPFDTELQAIIQRWPNLPEAIKAGILAMVRAASDAD